MFQLYIEQKFKSCNNAISSNVPLDPIIGYSGVPLDVSYYVGRPRRQGYIWVAHLVCTFKKSNFIGYGGRLVSAPTNAPLGRTTGNAYYVNKHLPRQQAG